MGLPAGRSFYPTCRPYPVATEPCLYIVDEPTDSSDSAGMRGFRSSEPTTVTCADVVHFDGVSLAPSGENRAVWRLHSGRGVVWSAPLPTSAQAPTSAVA